MEAHMKKTLWILLFGLASLSTETVLAKSYYCWMNAAEVEECGNYVPREYSKKGYVVKNKDGVVVKTVQPEISPEKRRQLEARARALEEARERAEAQAKADKKMLDSFPTEQDIEIQRTDKLDAIDAAIKVNNKRIEFYRKNLAETKKVLKVTRHKEDKEKMVEQIAGLEKQVIKFEGLKQENEQEKIELNQEYDAVLERYRQIKARQASGEAAANNIQMNKKLAETQGFRGVKMGQTLEELPWLQLAQSQEDLLFYRRTNEKLSLGRIALRSVDYIFYEKRVIGVRIRWKSSDDNGDARMFLEDVFGPPSNAAVEDAIRWHGKYVTILFRPNWRIIEMFDPKHELILQKSLFR